MNVNQTLLRLVKDVNDIKAALRQVTTNLPLYDIANENTPAAISTDQNNYVPGNYDIIRLSSTTTITITGLAGGVKGRSLKILNIGSNAITLANGSTSSLPENRFRFLSGIDFIVYPDSNIVLYYDISQQRWVEGTTIEDSMISKETTATVSSNQNNYNPTNYGVLRLNATANITITGFAGGVKGRFLRVFNVGTGEITIAHQNTGSLPQNRVVTPTGFGSVISPNEEFLLYYDSTQQRWITSYSSNADRISARLVLPADQSIADATYSHLSWIVNLDTGNFFDAGSPTLITIPQTGWYFIKTTVIWDVNGTNLRETFIGELTSEVPRVWDSRLAVNAAQTVVSLSDISYYSVGQNLRVGVWQNSGGNLNVLKERAPTSTLVSIFSVVKI